MVRDKVGKEIDYKVMITVLFADDRVRLRIQVKVGVGVRDKVTVGLGQSLGELQDYSLG